MKHKRVTSATLLGSVVAVLTGMSDTSDAGWPFGRRAHHRPQPHVVYHRHFHGGRFEHGHGHEGYYQHGQDYSGPFPLEHGQPYPGPYYPFYPYPPYGVPYESVPPGDASNIDSGPYLQSPNIKGEQQRSKTDRGNRRTSGAGVPFETVNHRVQLSRDYAPIDGLENNLDHPEWGSVGVELRRLTSVQYSDGISTPAGYYRPSPRVVSNVLAAQPVSIVNNRYLTDMVWVWGQFIDHDIDLTAMADPTEPFPIEVPVGDPHFDPNGTGTQTIEFKRSVYNRATGHSPDNPRQQINQITAFIDGSAVYGSDPERAAALRTFEGGLLKMSQGGLMPFNEHGLSNIGGRSAELFLAGDVRANENAALTAMHTLFVREHNLLAGGIAAANPMLSDEEIYQQARALVTAELQAITYNEFLPALLGPHALGPYTGYDPTVNPGVSNIFSTASYRVGHSLVSAELLRLDQYGNVIPAGNLALRDAFFASHEIVDHGIDSLLRGFTTQQAQEVDTMIVDDLRNFLFGEPGAGGIDLASMNIQRGRDHGLPDYNQARVDLGLEPVTSFAEITSNVNLQAALYALYGDVNNIDVWAGGLAEDHLPNSSVGELIHTVIADQFERLRAGDRFWYQNVFEGAQLAEIESTTLSDIIQRNTGITQLRENVFIDESVTTGAGVFVAAVVMMLMAYPVALLG